MNKFALKNSSEDKKIITFKISSEVKEQLKEVLTNSDNYNLKKKSDWVNEAIEFLKSDPEYKELVLSAEGNSKEFVFDKIYMTFNQRCFFSEMRNEIVRAYPDIRGPQAAMIRAAILRRLVRKL